MCAGMCPQNRLFIHIVCIRLTPPRMILRKAQGIEVLMCSDDRKEGAIVFITGRGEFGFDDGAGYRDGVIFLNVEFSINC